MVIDHDQGTEEWLAARVGRITGSRVGAVLGVSKYLSRQRLLKQMVEEALGFTSDVKTAAMQWGNDNEDTAVALYAALYSGDLPVSHTGLHVLDGKDWLAASPDRLVGDEGLVEIKCPYGLRNDESPEFEAIDQRQDYWHQMQLQMLVTDRQWCDFFQWTEHDYECVRVKRDPDWLATYGPQLEAFIEEYRDQLEKAKDGGAAEVLRESEAWQDAAQRFVDSAQVAAAAKSDMDDARKDLIAMMERAGIDNMDGLVKATKVVSKGTVDYKLIAKYLATDDELAELEEEYRRAEKVSYRVDIGKEVKNG